MSLSICFKKLNNQELDIDGYFLFDIFLAEFDRSEKKGSDLFVFCLASKSPPISFQHHQHNDDDFDVRDDDDDDDDDKT